MEEKVKILIVDDHKIFAEGIIRLLKSRSDYDVIGHAQNESELYQKISINKPDIIIMDIGLQRKDGIEISRKLLKEMPCIKILILSMHSSYSYISRSLEAGVSGYILKDSCYYELCHAIDSILQDKTFLSEQIASVYHKTQQHELNFKIENLTQLEKKILKLTVEEKSPKEISLILNLSQKEIINKKLEMMNKLGVESDIKLVKFALKSGFAKLEE